MIKNFIKNLFLTQRFYIVAWLLVSIFIFGQMIPLLFIIGKFTLIFFIIVIIIDFSYLFNISNPVAAKRKMANRLSNGDLNLIEIDLKNNYPFKIFIKIIDELPFQFQKRNFEIKTTLSGNESKTYKYYLKPLSRGSYNFGKINVFVNTKINLLIRRLTFKEENIVPVYPSYIQMKKYELLAISNRLNEAGVKKVRKLSHTLEFEQIKEYIQGDDFRTINWKATARKAQLMVNQYLDEKSQNIYCLIDMNRNMKMPFEGLSLLDYAINASLILSNIAMHKHDKVGLICFADKIHQILPAKRGNMHLQQIMEALYRQKTQFLEADYQLLYTSIKRKITDRSLLILFTNFEWHISLTRQIAYLKQLNKSHLLVVVFFENTEINQIIQNQAKDMETIYLKTVAEKLSFEKKLIVKELQKFGIMSILTSPKQLNVETINKYLEMKSLGRI